MICCAPPLSMHSLALKLEPITTADSKIMIILLTFCLPRKSLFFGFYFLLIFEPNFLIGKDKEKKKDVCKYQLIIMLSAFYTT